MPIINPSGLPDILLNGTLADATQVMANFNYIVAQVNANAQPLGSISGGALVNIQVISTSGTYNKSANANSQLILGVGAGGAGGGQGAFTGPGAAAGSGGRSGAAALIWVPSGLSSASVTIGAGGTGVSGGNGGNGGSSSFGGYLILPGGIGGIVGPGLSGSLVVPPSLSLPSAPSGSATIIWSNQGNASQPGIINNPATAFAAGMGGDSVMGSGGLGDAFEGAVSITGTAGQGFGAGGGGAGTQTVSSSSIPARAGYAGSAAAFIVFEMA